MTPVEKEIQSLNLTPDEFVAAVAAANKKIYQAVFKILSDLEIENGIVVGSIENLQKIELIAEAIRDGLENSGYNSALLDYTRTFEKHGKLVLETFDEGAKLTDVYQQFIKTTQKNVLELFAIDSVEYELVTPIKDILTQSMSTSTKLSDMANTIREFIEGSDEVDARLTKYAKQYAYDAISIFDANFTQVVNKDYDIQYWEYSGGTIKTTREFCRQRVGKAFTTDEVRSWASEDWAGKNRNTTAENIFSYRGGYNCMHILVPISKERYEKLK